MQAGAPVVASMLLVLSACGSRAHQRAASRGSAGEPCDSTASCIRGLECVDGICLDPTASGGGHAGSGSSDGGGIDAGMPSPRAGLVVSGSGELNGVYPVERGLLIVDERRARLVDRAGREVATFSPPRTITAAAWDGTYLGLADETHLTSLTADLREIATGRLYGACAQAVTVSEHRFVCAPPWDSGRVFSTYDLQTAAQLMLWGTWGGYGPPMRRVPGTDYLVMVSVHLVPPDFHLYEVNGRHEGEYIDESPHFLDVEANGVYAFHGSPSTHLVSHQGRFLRIFGDGCLTPPNDMAGCFLLDGDAGTLPPGTSYLAMTEDGEGSVYALRSQSGPLTPGDPRCAAGDCTIERIDSAARVVVSSRSHRGSFLAIPVMEHDPWSSLAILGVQTAGDRWDGWSTYEVRLAAYE